MRKSVWHKLLLIITTTDKLSNVIGDWQLDADVRIWYRIWHTACAPVKCGFYPQQHPHFTSDRKSDNTLCLT